MTLPPRNQAITNVGGVGKIPTPIFEERDPTSNDIGPPWNVQQTWVNTLTQGIWVLETFSTSSGVVSAQWRALAPIVTSTVAPTSSDYLYPLGQIWIDSVADLGYILLNVTGTTATWENFSGSGVGIDSIIVSSGTSPVVPDASGQITYTDGNGVGMTGGTNEITYAMVSPFTGNFTYTGTVSATTFDTNVAAAASTLTATTWSADGTDTNISLNITPKGTGFISETKTASGQWLGFNDGTDTFGYYNFAGSPEGNVAANTGSYCSDTTNGTIYVKTTDTVNTGWVNLVVGPASATDNAIARYDGTTGKLIQNSSVTVGDLGSIDSTTSVDGSEKLLVFQNTSDTASSGASIQCLVGGSSAADPTFLWNIDGENYSMMGLDNDDSDSLKINFNAASLGTNDSWIMTIDGERTLPLQPAFLAILATSDLNVTGAGTLYVLGSGNALTEIFDQGGDFVTTGTFTAPVAGRYHMGLNFFIGGLTALMTYGQTTIATSNGNYTSNAVNMGAIRTVSTAPDNYECGNTVLCDLDAADTVNFHLIIYGGAGDTADMLASGNRVRVFGALIC